MHAKILSVAAFAVLLVLSRQISADTCGCNALLDDPPMTPIVCIATEDCDLCEADSAPGGVLPGTYYFCECDGSVPSGCCSGTLNLVPPSPNDPSYSWAWICTYGNCGIVGGDGCDENLAGTKCKCQ